MILLLIGIVLINLAMYLCMWLYYIKKPTRKSGKIAMKKKALNMLMQFKYNDFVLYKKIFHKFV